MDVERAAQHARPIGRHVAAVQPVCGYEIRIAGHRKPARHAQIHVVVLAPPQPFVESARRDQQVTPVHHRRVHGDEVPAQQLRIGRVARGLESLADLAAVLVDVAMPAVDESAVGRTMETGEPRFDGAWLEPIVGVEKHDQRRVDGGEPGIPRRGQAAVLLADQPDAGKPRHDRRRIVRRAVVHDDHGVGRARLRADAAERLLEKMRVVVRRNHDTDGQWRVRKTASLRLSSGGLADATLRHGRRHGATLRRSRASTRSHASAQRRQSDAQVRRAFRAR